MERIPNIVFLILLIAFGAARAAAPVDIEDDGLTLDDDEGFVLFGVDTDQPLARLRIARLPGYIRTDELGDVAADEPQYFLYKLEAADYDLVGFVPKGALGARFVVESSMSEFTVGEGEIRYIGTLVLRFDESMTRSMVQMPNRASLAWDWLAANFPITASAYPFSYSGRFRDDFHAFWQKTLAGETP